MKHKCLIATTNKDKFSIVSRLLAYLSLTDFEFFSLKMINEASNTPEVGPVEDRAKAKALAFKRLLSDFDVVIGIDDGILLPKAEVVDTELKKITKQILSDHLLKTGDIIKICRAFYFVTKTKEYAAVTAIPFVYHQTQGVELTPNAYPLSQTLTPLNSQVRVSNLSSEAEMEYYTPYCRSALSDIIEKIKRGE